MILEQAEKQKRILSMMFPKQEKYHGNVSFGVKTKTGFRSMGYIDINKLEERIKEIKFYDNTNYYLTANTTRTGTRETDNLFSYNNIVIDIDCHKKELSNREYELAVEELLYRIERDLYNTDIVPRHNISVKTGRGIQLWWSFEQTAMNLGWLFHNAIDTVISHIENLLNEYESDLSCFEIDKGASRKDVGFFRMPFTINTKTGTLVKAKIDYEERYDINDFYNSLEVIEVKKEYTKKNQEEFLNNKWNGILQNRKEVIETHAQEMTELGVRKGYRNNYAWLYYNTCFQLYGEEVASSMLSKLNASFIMPLKENQLKAIKRYINTKGGLKMKNQTFYDYLGEEYTGSSREQERTEKRKAKALRNKKIKELYLSGMTTKEICEEMQLSKPTVLKILCIKKLKEERNEKIAKLKEQGETVKEIAEQFKLSIRTIQRKVKEKAQQVVEKAKELHEQLQLKECIVEKENVSLHKKNKVEREYQILLDTGGSPPMTKGKVSA